MIEPTQNSAAPGVATTAATESRATANADFTTFITLLTKQIQYQDPLNPQDPSDFAVQLATFSGVEQQAHTNKLLQQLVGQQGDGGLGHASGWIGKETRTTAPVWLGDDPLVLDIQPVFGADDARLVVLDAQGKEVSGRLIGNGAGEYTWDGRDNRGQLLPAGRYSFRLESLTKGAIVADKEVGVFAKIQGVSRGEEGTELIFANGTTAKISQVDLLRDVN